MRIKILDPVDCKVMAATKDEGKWLRRLLSYERVYYQRMQYGGERKEYLSSIYKKKFFPTGFLKRIQTAAAQDGTHLAIRGEYNTHFPIEKTHPVVPGMKLRNDQLSIVRQATTLQRGVIESPPGTGKTVSMMGIVSMIPNAKVLIVMHTQDLLVQTQRNFQDAGFEANRLGIGTLNLTGRLVVATRQSLIETYTHEHNGKRVKRMRLKERHRDWFKDLDAIIIDEVHLFGGMDGQYARLLRSTTCPMRLGFTGTVPDPKTEQGMAIEGLVGPVISQLTFEGAKDLDILSGIKLELLPVPLQKEINRLERYHDIYEDGIVNNRTRNKIIMQRVHALASEGTTTLVFVEAIKHGTALLKMAHILGVDAVFVNGEWDVANRTIVKDALASKGLDCVICTKVWREGVDIPNLGAVILAAGGKAKLGTLQAIGRGLRKAKGKNYAIIADLLDPYDYVAAHTIQRLTLYSEMGWIR